MLNDVKRFANALQRPMSCFKAAMLQNNDYLEAVKSATYDPETGVHRFRILPSDTRPWTVLKAVARAVEPGTLLVFEEKDWIHVMTPRADVLDQCFDALK